MPNRIKKPDIYRNLCFFNLVTQTGQKYDLFISGISKNELNKESN